MSGLKQAIELLRREIRNAHVKTEHDFHSMIVGSSQAFINLYRYLLCEFDRDISLYLTSNDFFLNGTTDRRFMEILYRICRDVLKIKPPLSLAQFFTSSFAEKKLKMAAEIVKSVSELQSRLNKRARGAPRNLGITGSTRSWVARRQITTYPSISRSRPSTLAIRIPVPSLVSQKAAGDDKAFSTSSRPLRIPQMDNTPVDLASRADSLTKTNPSVKKPVKIQLEQYEPEGDVVKTPDYMPDLITTLNILSNQISQIVDRVAGIELRVSAMEQPVRKAATKQLEKQKAAFEHADSGKEAAATQVVNPNGTDLPQISPNIFQHKRSPQPEDPLSLSDVNSSAEVIEFTPAPLSESKPSPSTAVAPNPDRYPPVFSALPRIPTCCEDGSGALRDANTVPQSAFVTARNPTGLWKAFSDSCRNDDILHRLGRVTKHLPMNDQSKLFSGGESPSLCGRQSPFTMNNKEDPINTTFNSNDSNARFEVDQCLKQQVNRISCMLAETQDLLNNRRPLPRS